MKKFTRKIDWGNLKQLARRATLPESKQSTRLLLLGGAIFAVLLLGFGGCMALSGGDEGSDSSDAAVNDSPATKAARAKVILAGDAICRDQDKRVAALNAELREYREKHAERGPKGLLNDIAPQLKRGGKILEDGYAKFEALDVPAADQDRWEAILLVLKRQLTYTVEIAAAAEKTDTQFFQATSYDLTQLSDERTALMQDYGFKFCGKPRGKQKPKKPAAKRRSGVSGELVPDPSE